MCTQLEAGAPPAVRQGTQPRVPLPRRQQLSEEELERLEEACDMALELNASKHRIYEYVESRMSFIAPNLSIIIGASTAAKIMGEPGARGAVSPVRWAWSWQGGPRPQVPGKTLGEAVSSGLVCHQKGLSHRDTVSLSWRREPEVPGRAGGAGPPEDVGTGSPCGHTPSLCACPCPSPLVRTRSGGIGADPVMSRHRNRLFKGPAGRCVSF